jgi:hypothetical protein
VLVLSGASLTPLTPRWVFIAGRPTALVTTHPPPRAIRHRRRRPHPNLAIDTRLSPSTPLDHRRAPFARNGHVHQRRGRLVLSR